MRIIKEPISIEELRDIAKQMFGDLVKAVVDVEKRIMAIDAELHSDEEKLLLETGSKQENLWGINLYPKFSGKDFIEFDSVINIRPRFGNMSRYIEDAKVRKKIIKIVEKLVER